MAALVIIPVSATSPTAFSEAADTQLVKAYTSRSSGVEVFNRHDGGFIVTSTDGEIIGYSDCGTFDERHAPAALLEILNHVPARRETPRRYGRYEAVAPLLGDIAYDQNFPYNLLTPCYIGTTHSATGCAATAMVQIMRYYKYPWQGRGSHSYKDETFGTISVDYSESAYDWDHMPANYLTGNHGETENMAIARLMYDAGTSISMQYGAVSGALSDDWPAAITKYFSYDEGIALRRRANYDIDDWTDVIADELKAGRPVFVTGFTDAGGHAFVCDGMDEMGRVHINWGWSGMSNGYFELYALTPASQGTGGSNAGFNSRQLIITGIMPPAEATEPALTLVSDECLTAPSHVAVDMIFKVKLSGRITNVGWKDAEADLLLALVDQSGNTVRTWDGPQDISVKVNESFKNAVFENVGFEGVPAGTYRLMPMARNHGGKLTERVRDVDLAFPNYLTVVIGADGSAETLIPDPSDLVAENLTLNGSIFKSAKCSVTATVRNNGQTEYYNDLRAALTNASGSIVATGDSHIIDLMPGEQTRLEILSNFNVAEGDYRLTIIDANRRQIATPVDVTVRPAAPMAVRAVSAPEFDGDVNAVDPMHINVTAKISGDENFFSGHIYLYFYDLDGETPMGCLDPVFAQAIGNEEVTVSFSGVFENAMPGEEYYAYVVNGESMSWIQPRANATTRFKIAGEAVIETIDTTETAAPHYYNLQGVEISRPDKGVYIMVGPEGVKKIRF